MKAKRMICRRTQIPPWAFGAAETADAVPACQRGLRQFERRLRQGDFLLWGTDGDWEQLNAFCVLASQREDGAHDEVAVCRLSRNSACAFITGGLADEIRQCAHLTGNRIREVDALHPFAGFGEETIARWIDLLRVADSDHCVRNQNAMEKRCVGIRREMLSDLFETGFDDGRAGRCFCCPAFCRVKGVERSSVRESYLLGYIVGEIDKLGES